MSEEKEREGKTRVRGQQLAAAINKGTFSEAIMICFTQPKLNQFRLYDLRGSTRLYLLGLEHDGSRKWTFFNLG